MAAGLRSLKKSRRARGAVIIAVTIAAMAAVAALVAGRRHKKAEPVSTKVPLAAGGAAIEEPDAGNDLVEDARRYAVRTWSFALDRFDLRIEDVGMGTALDALLERTGAELVVNGGFFDPEGKPLGLAMSDGAVLSRLSKTTGGVVTFDGDRARLWATETFTIPESTRFAIQCKPRLVVEGSPNVRSDDGKRSERTALCLRDGGKTMEVVIVRDESAEAVGGPSLFALGRFLARHGCDGALNLDGGPSTGIAWRENGAVKQLAPQNGIRHAITFKRRAR